MVKLFKTFHVYKLAEYKEIKNIFLMITKFVFQASDALDQSPTTNRVHDEADAHDASGLRRCITGGVGITVDRQLSLSIRETRWYCDRTRISRRRSFSERRNSARSHRPSLPSSLRSYSRRHPLIVWKLELHG